VQSEVGFLRLGARSGNLSALSPRGAGGWNHADGRSIEMEASMGLIVLLVVILLLVGALPRWGYSRSWGYGPFGGLGLVLLIIIVLLVFNVIPRGF
jgi:hypothetical protein